MLMNEDPIPLVPDRERGTGGGGRRGGGQEGECP